MDKRRIVLRFPKEKVEKPVIYHLASEYNLSFNILKATITPEEEGIMVLEIEGEKANITEGVKYLKDNNIKIEELGKDVAMNDDKCTSCGACVTVCPSGALHRDEDTFEAVFDSDKCTVCELCVTGCPYRAMEVSF